MQGIAIIDNLPLLQRIDELVALVFNYLELVWQNYFSIESNNLFHFFAILQPSIPGVSTAQFVT